MSQNFSMRAGAKRPTSLIGCVDSRKSRRILTSTSAYWNCYYWLDLGNNADCGQFVLGQPGNARNKRSMRDYPLWANFTLKLSIRSWTEKQAARL